MKCYDTIQMSIFSRRKLCCYGALAGLFVLGLGCVKGGPSDTVKAKALKYELSKEAKLVSDFLDRWAYGAAQGILHAQLPQHPEDAGLHAQYARFLVLSRSVGYPNFVQTPLYPVPNSYWASSVAIEAARRAVQLDPDAKAHTAAVLMSALKAQVEATLNKGEGIIVDSVWWVGDTVIALNEFQASALQVGWTALELHPETATAFKDDFRHLVEKSVKLGKVSSAAMLGNLVGALESGGVEGDQDFDLACDAFERALANYEAPQDRESRDWIMVTVKLFRSGIFKTELDAVTKGQSPESYRRLETALHERGHAVVETAEFQQMMKERETSRREAEERERRKALAPRIAEARENFAAAVYEASQLDDDFFSQRLESALNGLGRAFTFPSTRGFDAENELLQMKAFPSDLRYDPRIGWVLSSGKNARAAWSTRRHYGADPVRPSKLYAGKMERYLSPVVVHRRIFSDDRRFEERQTDDLIASIDEVIRFDTEIKKYLIPAAALPEAKRAATGPWNGPFWMTTLAEMALAVEREEAIVFDKNGGPLRFGKDGLVGYLIALEVKQQEEGFGNWSSSPVDPTTQVEFEQQFLHYVAAVRAGRDPSAGLDALERKEKATLEHSSQRRRRER